MRGLQADTVAASMDPTSLDANRWRRATHAMETASSVYRNAAASSGMLNVQQQRIVSQTEKYTELLKRQKLGLGEIIKNRKVLNATYREQIAMERMTATMWGTDARGRQVFDVTTPRIVGQELDNINRRLGFTRALIASASTQMVNLGKNTQWAGRQLMVGFTMPTLFAGVAAGAAFHQADKELTRIAKVYDTIRTGEGRNLEIMQLRAQSMSTAAEAAREYGSAMQDTLQVQADLAATGQRGVDLQKATVEVMRISKLGELDRQAAVDTTIALQNAFNLSTQELKETFDFFNATENATSLSLQDISEAVPRAASAMAALNVTAEEMTVMMVAMRERGVDAAEGANALKSATTRILNPVKRAKEYYKEFGISIENIAEQSGGNLFEFLKMLGTETANMTDQQKAAGIANLFGTYQFNRLNAAVSGVSEAMSGTADKTSQTAKAVELMGANTKELANLADRELAQSMESASGRFQKAVAQMKVELAGIGEPFHEAATVFVNFATGILEFVNNLPGWAKRGLIFTAMLAAIVGPVIMLTGLFLNFAGNIGKAMSWVLRLATSFEVLTKAQRLAQIHNELVKRSMDPATQATNRLEAEVRALGDAFRMASEEARRMMGIVNQPLPPGRAPVVGGQAVSNAQWAKMQMGGQIDFSGPVNYPAGSGKRGFMNAADKAAYRQQLVNQAHDEALEIDKQRTAELRKQAGHVDGIAASMAVSAAAMGAMALSSNETVDNVAMWALTAAMVAPAIKPAAEMMRAAFGANALAGMQGGLGKISQKFSDIGFNVKESAKAQRASFQSVKASSGTMRALGGAAAGVLGSTVGIAAALAAAGIAAYKLWEHSKNIDAEVKNIYSDAEGLAEIYGYEYNAGAVMGPDGKDMTESVNRVEQFREKYAAVVKEIENAKEPQEKFNLALAQGYKVITSGGSRKEAIQATRDALTAAEGVAKSKEIWIQFKADIDFSSPRGIAEVANRVGEDKFKQAFDMLNDKDWTETVVDVGSWINVLGSNNAADQGAEASWQKASKQAAAIGKQVGEDYYNGFSQAMQSGDEKAGFMVAKNFQKQLNSMNKQIEAARKEGNESEARRIEDLRRIIVEGWMKGMGYSDDAIKQMGAENYITALKMIEKAGYQLTEEQRRQLAQMDGSWNILDKTLWGAENNFIEVGKAGWFAAHGVEATGDAGEDAAGGLNKAAAAARRARSEFMKDWDAGDWAKGIYEGTASDVADQMESEFDRNMDRSIESARRAGEARLEAFDNETAGIEDGFDRRESRLDNYWERAKNQAEAAHEAATRRIDNQIERVENATDRRVDAIDRVIEREERAEDIRKRIFEAEMARVERLNTTENANIDFAEALNTGALDEAAKIMNDAAAREQEWALEDANAKAERASERRVAALEKRQEKLEKASERRIARLEKEKERLDRAYDAQVAQMEKMEERQREALEAQRERSEKAREEKRKWLEKEVEDTVSAEEAKWESRKENMDKAMDELRAFIPRSEKELNNHIARLDKRYGIFGDGLTNKGNRWAKVIGDALSRNINESRRQLQNDLDWEGSGKQIAKRLVEGAFGISLSQFRDWMITDQKQTPDGGGDKGRTRLTDLAKNGQGPISARHTGGPVGGAGGAGSRVGYARNAAPLPSESLHILKNDEFVMQGKAVKTYGTDFMESINSRKLQPYGTGGGGRLGMSGGLMGAIMKYAFKYATLKAGENVVSSMQQASAMGSIGALGAAKAGVYGNDGVRFDADQMRNAGIIANVGASMGMSQRDIQIGLMTAMQESMLRNVNYGDRDSLGLFQQRPSMGWGTPAQVTDPEYAARKFFSVLKGIEGRNSMPLTLAAQAVQRSAYPYAYAKWADEAKDIMASMQRGAASGGVGAGYMPGGGGWRKPSVPGRGWSNSHDYRNPIGSPLYAVSDGVIVESRAITSGGSPGNGLYSTPYRSYGETIAMRTASGDIFRYAHLNPGARFVRAGQKVRGGALIGRSGNTGNSSGPHTHFDVNGNYDALGWLRRKGVSLRKGAENIRWDNTVANLHRGESVLTQDISEKFRRGVDNFAEGGNSEYNVNVNVYGETVSADEIAKTVIRTIKREESRKGFKRTAGAR